MSGEGMPWGIHGAPEHQMLQKSVPGALGTPQGKLTGEISLGNKTPFKTRVFKNISGIENVCSVHSIIK